MKSKASILKKVLAATLALSVTAGCAMIAPVMIPSVDNGVVNAVNENGLQYQVLGDGTLEVVWASNYNQEEVVIPSKVGGVKVTAIGDGAFYGNEHIKKVTLPSTIREIGEDAFYSCHNLNSINIPSSVICIGKDAFCGTALKSITIPSSVKVIEEAAFMSTPLSSVKISEGVEIIGGEAFDCCDQLVNVTIPDSVTEMGTYAFSYCDSLKNVTIGKGLSELPVGIFNECSSITSITVPNNIRAIGGEAFSGCSSLNSVTVSANLDRIGNNAFANTPIDDKSKDEIYVGKVLYRYDGESESYTIKDGTRAVAVDALSDASNLKSLTIPDSVIRLDDDFIHYSSKLEEINGGNGLIYVGNTMIQDSPWFKAQIATGEDVYLGSVLFKATNRKRVLVKGGTLGIASGAFLNNDLLESVRLSAGLKAIESSAFAYTANLKEITFPTRLEYIGRYAFNCSGVKSITIPDSVKYVGNGAFCYSEVAELNLSSKMEKIPESAFMSMEKLKTVNIPEGVTYIGSSAFGDLPLLEEITLPETLKYIRDHAFCCYYPEHSENYINEIAIPASVIYIGEDAIGHWFYGSTNTHVTGVEGTEAERYAYKMDLIFNGNYRFYILDERGSVEAPAKITFTMSGNYGDDYEVYYKREGGKSWRYIGKGDGCYVRFTTPGAVDLRVVIDGGERECTQRIYVVDGYVKNTSTISEDHVEKGTRVMLYGSATGGTTNYRYTYRYKNSNARGWTIIQEGTTQTSAAFTPKNPGVYYVSIGVQDDTMYEPLAQEFTLYVYTGAPFENTSTVSSQNVNAGTRVYIYGSATGGTANYKYAYYYKRSTSSSWKLLNSDSDLDGSGFSTKTSASFKPTSAGEFDVRAVVLDADGTVLEKTFDVTVN